MGRAPRLAALVGTVVVALAGCTGGASPGTDQGADGTSAARSDTVTIEGCDPVERPPVQISQHLIGDSPPPGDYSSTPPTSGWHTLAVPEPGRASPPLRDAEIVSAVENGIVVAAVAPGALDDASDAVVDDLLGQFPDRLAVTAYDAGLDRPVTLLTWGALQRCDTLDPGAVTAFMLTERVVMGEH